MPVVQNGLIPIHRDWPPDSRLILGGEENAA